MIKRALLPFLTARVLLPVPGPALADKAVADLFNQLTSTEVKFVNSTKAQYAGIRAKLGSLQSTSGHERS